MPPKTYNHRAPLRLYAQKAGLIKNLQGWIFHYPLHAEDLI
jgi:hypothetical protein